MGKSNVKKYFLFLFILFLFSIASYFVFYKNFQDSKEEGKIILKVNDTSISERDIEHYFREVARNNFGEELSYDELKKQAIERAIMFVIVEEYYNKKNVFLSQDEIEEEIRKYIELQPGVETREEFFKLVEMRGYSREEFLRNTEFFMKNRKLKEIMVETIEIDESDMLEEYNKYIEDPSLLPFEELKEYIRIGMAMEIARYIIIEEINEEERNSEIVFFE